MLYLILAILTAYLLGSIPTGYIFGRLLKGVDIRKHGSGNVGATNVFRVVGKVPGVIVLLLDALKGFVAVKLAALVFYREGVGISIEWFCIIAALCAVSGHNWTIFLRFKGGKGVATSTGALAALMPQVIGVCFVIWAIIFSLTRIVSIASIIASLALPISAWIFNKPIELKTISLLLCLVSLYKHISNMKRLIKGDEKRLF